MQTDELRGRVILIVEDEILIAMEIESVLQDAGAEVVGPCASVAQALKEIETKQLSAATLDIRLGYETSEAIAAALSEKGVPFIFYSGQALPDSMKERWPDHKVLSKPAKDTELVRSIVGVARKRFNGQNA